MFGFLQLERQENSAKKKLILKVWRQTTIIWHKYLHVSARQKSIQNQSIKVYNDILKTDPLEDQLLIDGNSLMNQS